MFTSAPDYWSVGGFDLKSIVAEAYGVDESRVDFRDAAAAGKRYDVALVLPQPEDHDAMMGRIQDALKQKFNLKIASEDEAMVCVGDDCAVRSRPELRPAEDSMGGGFISSFGTSFALPKGQQPTPETIEKAIEQREHQAVLLCWTISRFRRHYRRFLQSAGKRIGSQGCRRDPPHGSL